MTGCTRSVESHPDPSLVKAEEGQACSEGELNMNVHAHAELANDLNEA